MENTRFHSIIRGFVEHLQVNGYYETTIKDVVSYLDRYEVDISGPQDVIHLFSKVKRAKRHVILAVRLLLNYYETLGYDSNYLGVLRKAIPRVRCDIDLKIPSESKIVESLNKLEDTSKKYKVLYNLLLDSGLRFVESVALINNFKDAKEVDGFFRCAFGDFRGTEHAYHGHFSESTCELIKELDKKLDANTSSHYFYKMGFVGPKNLRKFCFDKMSELEVPE
jgi:intergrase/recombinase